MISLLQVEPLDIAAPRLAASFDDPARTHLAQARTALHGRSVTAGILAASHQVVIDGGFIETVACDVDGRGNPLTDGTVVEGPGCRLTASVDEVDEHGAVAAVRDVLRQGSEPTVIVGRFPTHPLALTAVRFAADGWATMHTYPCATGATIVRTRTVLGR